MFYNFDKCFAAKNLLDVRVYQLKNNAIHILLFHSLLLSVILAQDLVFSSFISDAFTRKDIHDPTFLAEKN